MNGARAIAFEALNRIGVEAGNTSTRHAAHWLRRLGAHDPLKKRSGADIWITGSGEARHRCEIRLWDFQVGHAGSGILASAAGGAATVIGRADGLPLPLPAEIPEKWCALYGVILALAELWRRPCVGDGLAVRYDVSAADIVRSFALQNSGGAEEMRCSWKRNGRVCVDHGGIFPMGFFACRDGHVALLGRSRRDWRAIRNALGHPEWAEQDAFSDPFTLARDSVEADRRLEETLADFGRDELLARGLEHGAVIAPVYSQAEAAERGVFRQGFIDDDGPLLPAICRESPTAAPIVTGGGNGAPLAGLRCLELAWVWSGPMVGQILADLGAAVIKLESPNRFDLYRTRGNEALRGKMDRRAWLESSLYFHSLNRNKHGLALDLKHDDGKALFKDLSARSDLVLENFTVGTMDRLGLGAEALWAGNPRLCQLSMSGPGQGSAVENLRAYGLVLSALAGAEIDISDEGEFMGSPTFSLSDPNAAAFATMCALAGMLAARESGQGRAIDLSQIEAAAALAGSPRRGEKRTGAIVRADDGRDFALDLPFGADGLDLDGMPADRIGAAVQTRRGAVTEVLALEATDDAPAFAGCSGWLPASHPYTGEELLVAAPWRVDGARPPLRKTAPLLGESDDYVLRRILGKDEATRTHLAASGVVGLGDAGKKEDCA